MKNNTSSGEEILYHFHFYPGKSIMPFVDSSPPNGGSE